MNPLWPLAVVVVSALAWHAAREYIRAVVATQRHAAEAIAQVRAEFVQEQAARAKLDAGMVALLSEVKLLRARLPEGGIVPRGGR